MVIAAIDIGKTVLQAAALERDSGDVSESRVSADRESLAAWVGGFQGRLERVAIEATTGWKWIANQLFALGVSEVVLVDPGEAAARKGKKRRAKTDRLDARFLLSLLATGTAPEAWLPPQEIQELRALTRTRKALVDQRTAAAERLQALLFHEGWPCQRGRLLTGSGRRWVAALELEPPIRLLLDVLLGVIDDLDRRLEPLERQLRLRAREDRRLQTLERIYGVGPILACHLLAEIGDAQRFRRARQVVRLSGLDPVVLESGETKRRGRLAKAGPPLLRWALVEAAKHASRSQSPDHERWQRIRARRGSQVADITVARTIAGRAYRLLRELDEPA
jgi:transposase